MHNSLFFKWYILLRDDDVRARWNVKSFDNCNTRAVWMKWTGIRCMLWHCEVKRSFWETHIDGVIMSNRGKLPAWLCPEVTTCSLIYTLYLVYLIRAKIDVWKRQAMILRVLCAAALCPFPVLSFNFQSLLLAKVSQKSKHHIHCRYQIKNQRLLAQSLLQRSLTLS